jgi:hypothetical protein
LAGSPGEYEHASTLRVFILGRGMLGRSGGLGLWLRAG